jgi:hypothetical protein
MAYGTPANARGGSPTLTTLELLARKLKQVYNPDKSKKCFDYPKEQHNIESKESLKP